MAFIVLGKLFDFVQLLFKLDFFFFKSGAVLETGEKTLFLFLDANRELFPKFLGLEVEPEFSFLLFRAQFVLEPKILEPVFVEACQREERQSKQNNFDQKIACEVVDFHCVQISKKKSEYNTILQFLADYPLQNSSQKSVPDEERKIPEGDY